LDFIIPLVKGSQEAPQYAPKDVVAGTQVYHIFFMEPIQRAERGARVCAKRVEF
jgi:hypothetical protein